MTSMQIASRFLVTLLMLPAYSALAGVQCNPTAVSSANEQTHTVTFSDSSDNRERDRDAGKVIKSNVTRKGDHFLTYVDILINADLTRVRSLLTDYAHLDRLSPSIVSSQLLHRNKSPYQVRVTTKVCVWWFWCLQEAQVQDVTELDDGSLRSKVLPEKSDFSFGEHFWKIKREGGGTRVTYCSDLMPRFWVPPIIGTAVVEHLMLRESRQVVENLARLASSRK